MTWQQVVRRDAVRVGDAIIGQQAMHDFETGHIAAGVGIAAVHLGLDLVGMVIGSNTISDFSSGNWKGGLKSLGIALGIDVAMVVVGALTGGAGDAGIGATEAGAERGAAEAGAERGGAENATPGIRNLVRNHSPRPVEDWRNMSREEWRKAEEEAEPNRTPEQRAARDQSRNDEDAFRIRRQSPDYIAEQNARDAESAAREEADRVRADAYTFFQRDMLYGLPPREAEANRLAFLGIHGLT